MTKKTDGPRREKSGPQSDVKRPKPAPRSRPETKESSSGRAKPSAASGWAFAAKPAGEPTSEKARLRREKREAAKLRRKTTGAPRVHAKPRKTSMETEPRGNARRTARTSAEPTRGKSKRPPGDARAQAKPGPATDEPAPRLDLKWRRAAKLPDEARVELGKAALEPLPDPGSWIFLCREGFEQDLADELLERSKSIGPHLLARGLVATRGKPPRPERRVDITFARQAFPVAAAMREADPGMLAARAAQTLRPLLASAARFALHTFVPDSESGNRLSQAAATLHEAIGARLAILDPDLALRRDDDAREADGLLAQVCLARADVALVGVMPAAEAPSRMPGGRARMKVGPHAPSRAAMKVEEALEWLGVGPDPGDLCVDLGAAPGGWTLQLLERRARVVAVDPARLAPWVMAQKNVVHVPKNAFNFEPEEPVDWLFCDMVWRPLEVAGLIAKWGRWRKARVVVCNIKLPMDRKTEFVRRVREIIEGGGWKDVRTRHLYHDRDEITLTAWMR